MNAKLAAIALSLGLVVLTTAALAQTGAPPSASDIRREIAELKQLLQAATLRLEELERRLENVEGDRGVQFQEWSKGERQDSYLRFPIDVERPMMVPPTFRPGPMDRPNFLTPMLPDAQPDGIFEPGVPGPLDVPKLRP